MDQGDDSVGEVLAGQAWGPEFEPQRPCEVQHRPEIPVLGLAVGTGGYRDCKGIDTQQKIYVTIVPCCFKISLMYSLSLFVFLPQDLSVSQPGIHCLAWAAFELEAILLPLLYK